MHCTYIDDYVGVANRHFVGVDRMMWSSDYPHQASSWPHVAKLYGFALYA